MPTVATRRLFVPLADPHCHGSDNPDCDLGVQGSHIRLQPIRGPWPVTMSGSHD